MGYVYLIGESENDNRYKIGSTRASDVNTRLKQLQTGNSSPLVIYDYFETSHPFRLETMLHNHFKDANVINEWFELNNDVRKDFKAICEHYQGIIEALKDNPFFNKQKNTLIR